MSDRMNYVQSLEDDSAALRAYIAALEADCRWAMEIVQSTSKMALSLPVTGQEELKAAVVRDMDRATAWLAANTGKEGM